MRWQKMIVLGVLVLTFRTQSQAGSGNWSSLGSGVNGAVWAIAATGSTAYVGGDFTLAGGSTVNHIAIWNGVTWSTMGTGMVGPTPSVYSITIDSPSVYAGGAFISAGDVPANSIARWDGSSWHALDSGLSKTGYHAVPTATAMVKFGGSLYVGGSFTGAGAVQALNIARWTGTTWESLGAGLNGSVRALAVMGGNLYAAGSFDSSGSVRIPHIAMWNGSAWQGVGGGMDYDVYALAVKDSILYAGGLFTQAGGSPANNVARWNGSVWNSVGSGVDGVVYGLTMSGSDLFAGGFFTTLVGHSAKWDGSTWRTLGSGLDNMVFACNASGQDVYFGGAFLNANGQSAPYVANYKNVGGTDLVLSQGWNLVSIPRIPFDYTASVLFPAKNGVVFSYNTATRGYDTKLILTNGPGYWVNYPSASTVTISGNPAGTVTITAAQAGWVLVGSRATSVQVSSLALSNGASIVGVVFRYIATTRTYQVATTINPGEACWVNVDRACTITLP